MKIISKYILFFIAIFSGSILFAQTKTWTLKECVDQALGKNIQLGETQLTGKLNEINYKQAKANLYPAFTVTDGQAFNFGNSVNLYTDQSTRQNISSNNLALNGSMILYNGFQLKNTIKQSKLVFDAGNFDVDKMKNDITLNVVAGYLQVLYSYKALEIANSEVSSDLTQVDRTQKYVDAGKLAEGSLLQVQSQLATDKAAVVSAENQLQLAKVTLMQLMNMPVVDNFEVDSVGTKEPSVENINSSADIYKTSESIMPEIKSAELITKADETGIKIAQASSYPKLSLGGTLKTAYSSGSYLYTTLPGTPSNYTGYVITNPSELVDIPVPTVITQNKNYAFSKQIGDNFAQALSLNLTIPIFTNYQAKYGIEKARINLQTSQLQEQSVKDQLRKSVEQAYTDLTASAKDYAAAQDILKSEQRSYSDLEKKFTLGLATATDFLIEKNNYQKAQQSVVQAKYTYIFKSKIVDFYLGKPLN